jgi:hypothetical protein
MTAPRPSLLAIALLLATTASSCDSGGGGGGAPTVILTGSQGKEYLAALPFPGLHVEIDHVTGKAPHANAQALLGTRLNERCDKPSGVSILIDENNLTPGGSGKKWTLSEIRQLELQHRGAFDGGATKTLYILYVDGGFEADTGNSRVLGVAYSPSSFCVFKDNIIAAAGVVRFVDEIEKPVLVHEAGHILGLVNNGIPMVAPHEDPDSRAHDASNACVMSSTIESNLAALISGSIPDDFDAACKADMAAAGGK